MDRKAQVTIDKETLKQQVDAAIASAGLTIDPQWRAGIDAHFAAIAGAAALVMEFPLDDEVDPAPVFSP